MAKIGIVGAGSWGIALSVLLHNNDHEVAVWSIIKEEVEMLREKREHESKLPGVKLPEDMTFTDSIEEIAQDKDVMILAVPSPYTRSTCRMLKPYVKEGQLIVNVAKGVEDNTFDTLTDIVQEEIPQANAAVLSGPSHAEEVGRGLPTTCVAGAKDKATADYLQNIFTSPVFRVYTSSDMLGIELGGALKNVIALAAGMADGLGYGDNTKAALITRGITEIARLGTAMGGRQETFYGLTGIGDLIVTCASVHSRNRKAGYLIGKGYTMEQAMAEVKMIVEGVYSAKAALGLSRKFHVEMPIVEQVNEILFQGKKADEAVKELMLRDRKDESEDYQW
ncbi:MAG: NAD(P)H-dependent glycerol-3-phosphate dehydrogenase [Eubacteriales bacterium]|nr:NAD(P)H-dependent glycerol-3-phosphate dehydrogenase [Eubacteriales bacterium]